MVWDAQCNHYLGLGHHSGDPRGDPRGYFKGGIGDSYDGNDLGSDSYEKSYWKWSRMPSETT